MRNKMIVLLLLAAALLSLTGCGSAAAGPPPDLTGEWVQTGSENAAFYQVATITEDTITAYWYVTEDDVRRMYWCGTFVPPEDGSSSYTWVSENTATALNHTNWTIDDETKTFTYKKGKLVYNVNMGNMRMSVALEKISD